MRVRIKKNIAENSWAAWAFDPESDLSHDSLSEMYLNNLKASTPNDKVANIQLMLRSLEERSGVGQALHVAHPPGKEIWSKVSERP